MRSTVPGKENGPGLVRLNFILSLTGYLLTKHDPDTSLSTLRALAQKRTLRAVWGSEFCLCLLGPCDLRETELFYLETQFFHLQNGEN